MLSQRDVLCNRKKIPAFTVFMFICLANNKLPAAYIAISIYQNLFVCKGKHYIGYVYTAPNASFCVAIAGSSSFCTQIRNLLFAIDIIV